MQHAFPVIDPAATGRNIVRLRQERGLTVRDLQRYFGFEEPQAIYKWQRGQSLPTVDNLYALGALFGVSMEEILVAAGSQQHKLNREQQADACCSSLFPAGCFGYGRGPGPRRPIAPRPRRRGGQGRGCGGRRGAYALCKVMFSGHNDPQGWGRRVGKRAGG